MLNGVFIRVFQVFPVQMCSMAFAVFEIHFYLLLLDLRFAAHSEFHQKMRTMSSIVDYDVTTVL